MSRRSPTRLCLAMLVGWVPVHSDRVASASGEQCSDQSAIALIGHETDNGAMFRTAETLRDAGFADVRVGVAGVSSETDLVMVFVNAPDGPMPGTRESIEELAGFDELPLALVLTNTDQVDDPELLQLVETESVELLETNGLSHLAVLTTPAQDLVGEVGELLGLPAGEPDASCDGPNEIVLVGQRDQFSLYVAAERLLDTDLGDVAIGVRDVSTSTELVLVVVSARGGLKEATRSAITELADLDVPRVALLITESSGAADQEQLDSVRLDAIEALTASGFDAVPVVMTEGWPTISTGVTAPHDEAFVAAVSALLDWAPGEPAPPDVQVTIPTVPAPPDHAVLENVATNIPVSSATELLNAQGFEVVSVPAPGTFGNSCDPLVQEQVPAPGLDLARGTRILLVVNVDSGTGDGEGCPYWEISPEDYLLLVAEILAQPGVEVDEG